ncbi:Uncharacterised protein [Mycobacteroides abscessus subsp. abscessus]|nr:Uncharacterised protein [Mycobacteroides abscessus subsp. abscessus]
MRARRQCRSLARLQVHDVVTDGAAAQGAPGFIRLTQQCQVDPKTLVGPLGTGDRLEHQVHREVSFDEFDRGGDMREHTRLRGNVESQPDVVDQAQQVTRGMRGIRRRVDADDGVTTTQQQAIERGCRDTAGVVGGMIGLQPGRQGARQANGGAEGAVVTHRRTDRDEVLIAHQLAHRRDHLRRKPR